MATKGNSGRIVGVAYTLNITIMYCIKIGNQLVAKDFKSYPEAQAWKNYHCPKGKVTKQ